MFPQPFFISNSLDYYNQVQYSCVYVVNPTIPHYELVYRNHHYQVVSPCFAYENPPNPREHELPPPQRTSLLRPRQSIRATPTRTTSSSSSQLIPINSNPDELIASNTTTLMIKNIPNQFGRDELLGILKDHCLDENLKYVLRSEPTTKSEFDFVYLPMDFDEYWEKRSISNLGYAFVNFTSNIAAVRFCKKFHKFEWSVRHNKKTCEVVCAKIQGKKALRKSFKEKVFWCHSSEYLPVILQPPCDGVKNPRLVTVGRLSGKPKIRNS